jgi:hypothetical protein
VRADVVVVVRKGIELPLEISKRACGWLLCQELLGSLAGQAFASSMTRRGMSSADEKLQLRSEKLAGKLRDKSMAGSPTGRPQRFSAFLAAFRLRWKQRTTCQPGYVIAECRNGPPLSASPAN